MIDKIVSLIVINYLFFILSAAVQHACDASAILVEFVDKAGAFKQAFWAVFKALIGIRGD